MELFIRKNIYLLRLVVIISIITASLVSCRKRDGGINPIDFNTVPRQVIDNMVAIQTSNGAVAMRMEARRMESYSNDSSSFELFPDGFNVYGYTKSGDLETKISSNQAKHIKQGSSETWIASGNVVINNFIKGERMETDTLYWDRYKKIIYTHTFVKFFSPKGYMQGYGMESDELAKNAVILRPFDSYGIVEDDSTRLPYIDTINFIGPMRKYR